MIPAGWRQKGHLATKILHQFPSIQHGMQKNGWGTYHSTSWATPSAYDKQNGGEPGQTAGWSSHCYEGHIDLMFCREAGGGRENTSNVLDCIRFATWNIGTMTGKSEEVVETLHSRKIDVCCVQETTLCFKKIHVTTSSTIT